MRLLRQVSKWVVRHRWLVIGILLVPFLLLTLERYRGKRMLASYKKELVAKGEILDPLILWPNVSQTNPGFSNRLAQASQQIGKRPSCIGTLTGMLPLSPGTAARSSQEQFPYPPSEQRKGETWDDLIRFVDGSQAARQNLRDILKAPPASLGWRTRDWREGYWVPNFVALRTEAQTLQCAAVAELHRNNLPGAWNNLAALSAMAQLYRDDPTLVNQMRRVALLGLCVPVHWDALQADGWTEPQLSALQQNLASVMILPAMVKVFQWERIIRLYHYEQFRTMSYNRWAEKWMQHQERFGLKVDRNPALAALRHWLTHPLWSYAWADQEMYYYLKEEQLFIDRYQALLQHPSWLKSTEAMAIPDPPFALWRFYCQVPIVDGMDEIISPSITSHALQERVFFPPNVVKAWDTVFKNLAQQQLLVTAIALKRHHLRHSRYPNSLAEMVPQFLERLPLDYMDGKPLRYRLNANGTYTLYSVGLNGTDDGGDPRPPNYDPSRDKNPDMTTGRDWVWPTPNLATTH